MTIKETQNKEVSCRSNFGITHEQENTEHESKL